MEIRLEDAYALKTPQDNRNLYAQWAKTYESEFVASQGYEHPKVIAEFFNTFVPKVDDVVDVGTGTGLVGLHLKRLRPEITIDGIDISPEMLYEARAKSVYRNLYERDLTCSIEKTAAPYDALICIGIFTHGHLGPSAINNLMSLVKSGGFFVIGANAKFFKEEDFTSFLDQLRLSGQITKPSYVELQVYAEKSPHRDSLNVVSAFQKS